MTFATRDRYRHVVERIAKRTGHRETSVAQLGDRPGAPHRDVGRATPRDPRRTSASTWSTTASPTLERLAGYAPTSARADRTRRARPTRTRCSSAAWRCGTLAALVAVMLAGRTPTRARRSGWCCCFALLPALDIAVTRAQPARDRRCSRRRRLPGSTCTNTACRRRFARRSSSRRCSAAWTMCARRSRHLEVQFLANREAHLHFAVLSDFTDAATEVDARRRRDRRQPRWTASARSMRATPATSRRSFHLLHRPRRWNPAQGVWMGWERKRGKLSDFNRLLRGGATDAFSVISGDTAALRDVQVRHHARLPTRCCRRTPRRRWSARWRIRSIAPCTMRSDAHRARLRHPAAARRRLAAERASLALRRHCVRASRASIRIPPRSPTSTRTSTARGASPARASTTSMPSSWRRTGASRRTRCSRTTCIEGNYARAGLATDVIVYDDYPSTYIGATRAASTAGFAATGSCCPGSVAACPGPDGPEPNRLSLVSQWKIHRQPAPQHRGDLAAALPGRRMDRPAGFGAPLDAARPRRHHRAVG